MNLFVARLDSSTTGDDLKKIFSQYGEVTSVKIIFDRETGNSKGYGFVEMPNDEEAENAIAALNESEIEGKKIVVKQSAPREEGNRPARKSPPRGGKFQNRAGGGGFQQRDGRRDDRRGGGGGKRFDNRGRGGGGGGYDHNERW